MKESDSNIKRKHLTIIGIVVVVLVALFILTKAVPNSNTVKEIASNEDLVTGLTSAKEEAPAQKSDVSNSYTECLGKYNIPSNSVVFIHSDYCPHCRNMVPIIEELEKEGYQFYWAESEDSEARQVVSECFSDLMTGYVPQFICPINGEEYTGEMPYSKLKEFSEACN